MSLDSLLWTAVGGKDRNGDGGDRDDDGGSNNEDGLKFLFVGGKGGVGKSTTSSAIAILLATKCAKRVLLVSTDPAHSLSDVFRRTDNASEPFGNVPTAPEPDRLSNLHVMEIDPTDTMKRELAKWANLANDIAGADSCADTTGSGSAASEFATRIHNFQEWLSGIPGIDEATALSAAIRYIESGNYDMIVFDTAPTGHTLKLLQMPDILQVGIERLQSWQGTLWGYYETIKGLASGTGGAATARKKTEAKAEVSNMLGEYKRGIQKVAQMLQDQHRTRFAVICIAEYLSVAETRRLMQELRKNRVRASHIIVNQLVVDNALSDEELRKLEGLAEVGTLQLNKKLLDKTVHACTLTTARRKIQEKYLNQLKAYPETQDILDGICEAPLLPEEVTGTDALIHFGELLVIEPPELGVAKSSSTEASNTFKRPLYDNELGSEGLDQQDPATGDRIVVVGLAKSKQYNDLQGVVTGDIDTETGRYAIEVEYDGKQKKLALRRQNFRLVTINSSSKRQKVEQKETLAPQNAGQEENNSIVSDENISKAKQILADPEIKAMVDANPRFAQAVQDVTEHPMNFMQYLMDPELSPLISKAMSKLQD
mmetsp:Transcript_35126/g.76893  ORF Transcript_35126/g.76893 Transcript_35126/m.76893 type:complete len:598 (+) Transcript_35126:138-1931(+)